MSNKALLFRPWLEEKYYDKPLREVFLEYFYKENNLDTNFFVPKLIEMGYKIDDSYQVYMSTSYRPISWGNIEHILHSKKHDKVMALTDGWIGSTEEWDKFSDPDIMEDKLEKEEVRLYSKYLEEFNSK